MSVERSTTSGRARALLTRYASVMVPTPGPARGAAIIKMLEAIWPAGTDQR